MTAQTSSKAARAPKATKAEAPAAPAQTQAPVTPPPNGYVLLKDSCNARAGSTRAIRWPLLVEHSGRPDGKAAFAAALAAEKLRLGDAKLNNKTAAGTFAWLRKAGLAAVG